MLAEVGFWNIQRTSCFGMKYHHSATTQMLPDLHTAAQWLAPIYHSDTHFLHQVTSMRVSNSSGSISCQIFIMPQWLHEYHDIQSLTMMSPPTPDFHSATQMSVRNQTFTESHSGISATRCSLTRISWWYHTATFFPCTLCSKISYIVLLNLR